MKDRAQTVICPLDGKTTTYSGIKNFMVDCKWKLFWSLTLKFFHFLAIIQHFEERRQTFVMCTCNNEVPVLQTFECLTCLDKVEIRKFSCSLRFRNSPAAFAFSRCTKDMSIDNSMARVTKRKWRSSPNTNAITKGFRGNCARHWPIFSRWKRKISQLFSVATFFSLKF